MRSDPAYREEVLPLTVELLEVGKGARYLDLGCGEGQVMRAITERGGRVAGCDSNGELLRLARRQGPVVRARLPGLGWAGAGSFDGALAILVLEHLEDLATLFEEVARAVRPEGCLVAVLNHPAFTAPGSGPIVDPDDGEVLWRWGRYLVEGTTREPAGERRVTFHHRPLGALVGVAARAGWYLERLEERGAGEGARDRDPLLALQAEVPRLLGVRWRRV